MATRDAKAAVWNNSYQPADSVSWSGGTLVDGGVAYASGEGTVKWFKNGVFKYSYTGAMVRGKLEGKVRNRDADGSERDVWYANGKRLKGPPAGGGGGFPFGRLSRGDSGFMYTREGRVAVWNNSYRSEDGVDWSGTSVTSNGVAYASGQGTVSWFKNGEYQYSYTGTMVGGKLNGRVTTVDKDDWGSPNGISKVECTRCLARGGLRFRTAHASHDSALSRYRDWRLRERRV